MPIIRVTIEVNKNDWDKAADVLESLADKLRQPVKPPDGSTVFRDGKGKAVASVNYYS